MRRYCAWSVVALLVVLVGLAIHYPPVAGSERTRGAPEPDYIYRVLQGDLVGDADPAIALAALLIRRNWGEDTLSAQQPLVAREDGDCWPVDGTARELEESRESFTMHMRVNKKDARVAALHWTSPNMPGSGAKQ